MLKAIKRLCAALWRRERARLAVLRAADADALVEAAIIFGVEARVARRWASVVSGRLGLAFRLPIHLPSDLVDFQPAPTAAAAPAMGLRIVR